MFHIFCQLNESFVFPIFSFLSPIVSNPIFHSLIPHFFSIPFFCLSKMSAPSSHLVSIPQASQRVVVMTHTYRKPVISPELPAVLNGLVTQEEYSAYVVGPISEAITQFKGKSRNVFAFIFLFLCIVCFAVALSLCFETSLFGTFYIISIFVFFPAVLFFFLRGHEYRSLILLIENKVRGMNRFFAPRNIHVRCFTYNNDSMSRIELEFNVPHKN